MIAFCHVTTHVEGEADPLLLREKGGRGFPYLVFMDENGEVLAKQTERTVAGFQKSNLALSVLHKLDKPSLLKDKSVAAAVYIARLELGKFDFTQASAAAKSVELNGKQQTIYDREITNLAVADLYAKARENRDYSSLGSRLVEMKKAGKIPTGTWSRNFWSQIMSHAQSKRDAKLYEEAYGRYKTILGADKRYQRLFDRYDLVLRALKNGDEIPQPPTRQAVRIKSAGTDKKE